MDTKNNIQNLPQSLDLNAWLKLTLVSTNELNRQIALEEVLAIGCASEFDKLLKELAEKDPSTNFRSQANWLLKTQEAKSALKSVIKQLDVNPELITRLLQKGDYANVYQCTQLLRKSPSEETLNKWRQVLQKDGNPKLIETGLNILAKFGNESDSTLVIKYLQNQDPQIVCSVFSFLAQKNQPVFKKYIKLGLSSKKANVLLHSVHLLRTVDEAEAIKYLSSLILNNNALVRQKAMRELMLIDFNKVQDLFWQYIGREEQPLLLVKAGILVTINPNQNYPFKIYDILSLSTGIKKHIMQLILKQSLETTQAAGILKDKSINALIAEIQQYINNKKKEQLIRVAIGNLKASENNIRLSAVDVLSEYISHPQIKTLLENQLKIETDADVKSAISSLFEDAPEISTTNSAPTTDNQAKSDAVNKDSESNKPVSSKATIVYPPANEFVKLSPKEQRSLLNSIDCIEKYPAAKKTLIDAVDYADLKKATLLEILKKIGAYGNSSDAKLIYHMTKAKDHSVIAQTVKTVGTIDLDIILPELNIFLAHEDPRIKSAAFEVYILADKPAAVQYVATMLKQASIPIKRIGISLLPLLDYPSVEPLLWWLLSHEDNVEIQDQAGYMVAANPTQEGISRLFEFTHDNNGEIKEGFSEMWTAGLTSAESVFGKAAKDIEEDCWNNMLNEKNAEEAEKSDYKFKSVVGENEEIAAELEANSVEPEGNFLEKILLLFFKYKNQCIAGACAIALLAYLTYEPDDQQVQHSRNKEIASEVNFVPREASDKTTQVGDEDWQGVIRSGAREILNSKKYASLMQSAAQEQKDFREEAEKQQKEYFRQLANDPNADQDDRDWAAANLNDDYVAAKKAFAEKNYKDAEYFFERAANNPSLNSYGKLDAMQSLMEIYDSRKDKQNWTKWLSRMLKELKTMPEYSQVEAFENIEDTFGQIQKVSDYLKTNPEGQAQLKESLKSQYKMSETEADQAIRDLTEFKHPFNEKK